MEQALLNDFTSFLGTYRDSWNSLDAERMSAHNAKGLQVRWADADHITSDWGYEEEKEGWKQAYQQYEGRNPKWYFEDVLVDVNNQGEGVAVFWVRFEVDGEMVDVKLLFTETFRKEAGEWKKIRESVEHPFSNI